MEGLLWDGQNIGFSRLDSVNSLYFKPEAKFSSYNFTRFYYKVARPLEGNFVIFKRKSLKQI